MSPDNLTAHDLSAEAWREYVTPSTDPDTPHVYRIDNPRTLFLRAGGTTHRVLDAAGVVHAPVAPSDANGVVLRWKPRDEANPVQF